jgi:hypothetical protein
LSKYANFGSDGLQLEVKAMYNLIIIISPTRLQRDSIKLLLFHSSMRFPKNYFCFLLVYQQIPQNFYQSNIEVFAARTRRSVDYNSGMSNGSIYHDLSKDPFPTPLIESSTFKIFFCCCFFQI